MMDWTGSEGREGGRRSGAEVRSVVGTCGRNLKPVDIHNTTQKIVVLKRGSTNLEAKDVDNTMKEIVVRGTKKS